MRQFIAERPLLHRLLTLATMLLVVGTLLVLANILPHAEFRRGSGLANLLDSILALFTERSAPQPLIFPPAFWDAVTTGFWILFTLTVAYLIFTRDGRRELPRLVTLLLRGFVFAWLVLIALQLGQTEEIPEEVPISGEPADLIFDDFEATQLPDQLEEFVLELPESPSSQTVLIIIGILLAVALLVQLWHWWRYQRMSKQMAELPVDVLRLRALQALNELRQGDVPLSDVIRRCYREMVKTVHEQRGLYREQHVTPREFEERLLKVGFPQPPVQRLTRLFEQVRYGHATVGEREKRQAIDSLEQIVVACEQLRRRGRAG